MSDDFPSLYTSAPASSSTGPSPIGTFSTSSAAQALEQVHLGQDSDGADALTPAAAPSGPASSSGRGASSLDLNSESAFPSLGAPSAGPARAVSGWGAAKPRAPVTHAQASPVSLYTESLVLPSASISVSPLPPPPRQGTFSNERVPEATTLGGVINQIMQKFPGVKIEASTSTAKATTTFLFKAARPQDVERVKQELRARVVKKVTETIQVPASTRRFIIGASGRTLKSITEETGVNIQIPRDIAASATVETTEPSYDDDEERDDPLIPISLYGDGASVAKAKSKILAIVNERTSRLSTKVTTVSRDLYHLLSAKVSRKELLRPEDADLVSVNIPPVWKFKSGNGRGAAAGSNADDSAESHVKDEKDLAITVTGDREAVNRAVEALHAAADEIGRTSQTITITLNKRQHRFIVSPASDEILLATGCSIEVPPASSSSDEVVIRGPSHAMVEALQMVMQKANAAHVDVVDLAAVHGISTPPAYASQVARFLLAKSKLRKIADDEHVQIYIPRPTDVHTTIEIVAVGGPQGPAAAVNSARTKVLDILKSLPPTVFDTVEVDQLLHRFLIGKKGAKINSLEEKYQVQTVFPSPQAVDNRTILIAYVGNDLSNAQNILAEIRGEILRLAKDAADITTSTLKIPSKLHRYIIGPNGTTLNALIGSGDDRIVSVRFGSSLPSGIKGATNADALHEDDVVIRGPSDEVAKAVKDIERIAEEAKNDDIVNGYIAEFDVEQRFVSHVVGKGGAGIQKLREELGVRIDVGDANASSDSTGTKKPVKSAKTHVKIQGRKENAEEAKRRILKQVDQLADETTLSIPLLSGLERGNLIGKQGAYVQRLESKYDVRINFPKSTDEGIKNEAITIRGGKKGAEGAKKELVELMEYEKEHNQSATLTVPGRALAKILGRQGAAIRELQEETGADIDVSKNDASNPSSSATITIKGTKQAIAAAKKSINAVATEIQDESVFELNIERPYHVTIIGKGGQNIRELIAKCGGPTDPKSAGNFVKFPRPGENDSTVTVRGPSAVAQKIKDELEKQVATLRDRVVYGLAIPQAAHARLIGRGGAGVNDLQKKHDVRIAMPTWSEAKSSGEIVNREELGEVIDADLIRIIGSRNACEAAAADIKQKLASSATSGSSNRQQRQHQAGSGDQIVKTVIVPSHLHTRITQGGKFFRTLPNGIRIDHGDVKPPTNVSRSNGAKTNGTATVQAAAARIDEDDAADNDEISWVVTPLSSESPADSIDIPWNIRGTDENKIEKVEGMIKAALLRCQSETHQGVLTVPQPLIPRIVGRQGSGLDRLRSLGVSAEVEGRQGANSVTFMGTPETLEKAREMVTELTKGGSERH